MKKPSTILIVDDVPKNIQLLAQILQQEGFQLGFANNGRKALEVLESQPCDLVLLDVMMPVLNGFDTCREIRRIERFRDLPVIFTTALNDSESIVKGFAAGGTDYVSKPINSAELLARVRAHLDLKSLRDQEIVETQKEIIFTMGAIGETRSRETGNHVKRVAEYSRLLARLAGLPDEEAEMLKMASPMHDIGKVGIPDAVLNKPGKLNAEEWSIMQSHAELGYEMLRHSRRPLLKAAACVAREHHEKYDGSGYPRRLAGEDIHIYGRITALADVFDALGSDRCYKKAWELERILELVREERGKHFDPELVPLFLDNLDDFLAIRDTFADGVSFDPGIS